MKKPLTSIAIGIFLAGMTGPLACAAGPAVEIRDGHVFWRPQDGAAKQLTHEGHDSAPVLSPDGRWIVFVRAVAGKKIHTGSGESEAAELWQIRTDGKQATRLVAPRDADNMQQVIAAFDDACFSPDGRYVFFLTPAYATSGAVHVVDTTNGKEHFLMAGNSLEVVPAGEYRGCLLVEQHRYFLGGGSYDWIWPFKPDGKEIGPVGDDATHFKELYVTDDNKAPMPR